MSIKQKRIQMEHFNINNVIEAFNLTHDEAAKVLFPTVKYPKQAFDRILKGEATLSIEQVQRLAKHLGVLPHDLLSVDAWKGVTEDGCITLLRGPYKVKLNYNNVYLTLYKNNVVLEQQISNCSSMTIQEFTNYIDNLIKKYDNV